MIYVVSLPRIDTRYTPQWFDCARKYVAEKQRGDIRLLGHSKPFCVLPSEFLDYREYFQYVWPQLMEVVREVCDGDTVFLMDGETAGMEALEYVRKMEGIDFSIRFYWHSGVYDLNDLPYLRGVKGEHFERGWFEIADKIYVGSAYHRDVLYEYRGVPKEKIEVTGSPMDLDDTLNGAATKKTRDYLYTGRLVPEKGYEVVGALREQGVDIAASLECGWSKAEYLRQVASSRMLVCPSKHELFGYSIMEAFAMNVPVMVPDIPTYQTIVPPMYRVPFEDFILRAKFEERARAILQASGNERAIVEPYEYRKVFDKWFVP